MASSLFCLIVSVFLVQSISAASQHQFGSHHFQRLAGRNGTIAKPPAPFNCIKSGFFGDLKDCTRFYRCVDFYGTEEHFTLFEFVCGEGTIFDESLSVCNHPSWVTPVPACLSGSMLPPSGGVAGTPGSSTEPAGPVDAGSAGSAGSGAGSAGSAGSGAGSTGTGAPCSTESSTQSGSASGASTEPIASSGSVSEMSTGSSASSETTTASFSGSVVSETSTSIVDSVSESSSSSINSENNPGSSTVDSGAGTVSPVDSSSSGSIPDGSLISQSPQPSESSTSLPSDPDSGSSSSTESAPPSEASSAQTDSTSQVSTQSIDSVTESTTVSSAPSSENTSAPPLVQPPTNAPSFSLICGDQKFHRHPLRCDLYYQCVWTELSFSIDLKACPAGSVYDEPSGSCLAPEQSAPCQIDALTPSNPEPSTEVQTTTTTTTIAPQYTLAPGSLYNCEKPGHHPYQLDCVRFYRCFEVQPNVLKGLLYRCPPTYGYSAEKERCVKQDTLPPCDRTGIRLPVDYPVPLIPLEDTTMVRVEDLESFFSNPNSFYRPSQFRYIFFK